MASPLHVFSFLYDSLQGLLSTLLAARPTVGDGCAADAFLSPRHEDRPNRRRILQVVKTCDDAGLERDAKEGETLQQDSPSPERRRSQHSHDCTLQLNTGFRPSAEPYVPRVILDSGASHHVVGDISLLSWFVTIAPGGSDAAYQARDGRLLTVAGAGTISSGNFNLPDVMYVPDLRTAVILVSVRLLAQSGYLVMFGGGQCHVKDQSSSRIVGKGRLHNDDTLYHLEFLEIPPDTADATDTMAP